MNQHSQEYCAAAMGGECPPSSCRWRCAVEVIDELLGQRQSITGEQMDHFLDLRWQLARQEDAEETLRVFSHLRIKMESSHYLVFFRIRRWLENNIEAHVFSPGKTVIPIKLDNYCVEAIRRQCLCVALKKGLHNPALRFAFKSTVFTALNQTKSFLPSEGKFFVR